MHKWLLANLSLFKQILSSLDTPVSLGVWLRLKNREWDQLAKLWLDPQHYPEGVFSALKYRRDVQAVDLLRKAPLPTTFDRREQALAAWEDAETLCFQTNQWLIRLNSDGVSPRELRIRRFLANVKRRLGRWLGPIPPDLNGGFGPGTCVEYQGGNPTVVDKIWLTPTTTSSAAPYFSVLYGRTHWGRSRVEAGLPFLGLSRGNRLTTVPKDGKTDRPISIEPLGNLWLQLGIGRHLKRRLGLCGLPRFETPSQELFPGFERSYETAQDVHRRLLAGRNHGLVTIDLSSASDTVSLELVRNCFPPDWFELMNDTRSRYTFVPSKKGDQVKGRYRLLEKFSSMGNGFTFEMESFLFLALICEAFGLVPGESCWVFGDDIIIPERFGVSCMNLLRTFGFIPNERKSYISGPFRESCGANFHSGLEVTPIRIKEEPDSILATIALHNNLLRWGVPFLALRGLRDTIPIKWRLFGPETVQTVLHGGKWKSVVRKDRCPQIRWLRAIRLEEDKIPLERWSPELAMTAILLGCPPRIARRGARVTPRFSWVSVS